MVGNKVYYGQSEENRDNAMGAVAAIDATKTGDSPRRGELWRIKEHMVGRSQPILVDDRLYAPDESGTLYVLDPKTGEPVQQRRTKMLGSIVRSSPLYADGKIYMCSTSAWHVFEPTKDGVKVVHRFRFPIGEEECYGSPIVSHGRMYLTTNAAMYCLAKKDAKTGVTPRPEAAKETAVGRTRSGPRAGRAGRAAGEAGREAAVQSAAVQRPGQRLESKSPPKFAVDANGEIDAEGTFMADSSARHVAATVSATVDGVSRLRPRADRAAAALEVRLQRRPGADHLGRRALPPRGPRRRRREGDGQEQPSSRRARRSQSWMGCTDMHDYTIQADVWADIKDNKTARHRPDRPALHAGPDGQEPAACRSAVGRPSWSIALP